MNKAQLVDFVASEAGMTKKDARAAAEAVIGGIIEGLTSDGKVTLVGFGTFSVVERAARTARNPKTGEAIDVPAKVVPKFKASAALKELFEGYAIDDGEDDGDGENEVTE